MIHKYDVVIAGAGPAGMAAAMALAEYGVDTAVIDDNILPGGQVYRQPPTQFKFHDTKALGMNYQKGKNIIGRFEGFKERIAFYPKAAIIAFFNEREMSFVQNGEYREIQFEKLIICEGATERVIPFPGWTLPGVMTAGGLQKLLLNQRVLPGKRLVLSGTGPLLLSVASSILSAGGSIAAYLETSSWKNTFHLLPELLRRKGALSESVSYLWPLLKHRVPIRQPYAVVSAEGHDRVEFATISRLGADGQAMPGSYKRIKADVIGINHGFLPSTRLTRHMGCEHKYDSEKGYLTPVVDRFMKTSLDSVYAAGDGTGIGGAVVAEIEGHIAGHHAAAALGKIGLAALESRLLPVMTERQSLSRFADAMFSVFKYRKGLFDVMDRDTVVCRCEQVTAGNIWDEIEMGSRTLADLKPARFAMGRCQGRVCEAIVCEILRQKGIDPAHLSPLHIRPPVVPVSISTVENTVSKERKNENIKT